MKILVTGANGFVGQALSKRLIELEYKVYGLDQGKKAAIPEFKKFYSLDITHPFDLNEKFDFVFHLAAYNVTHVGNQSADRYHLVNVRGTKNVLQSAEVKNFIFLSTTKVYLPEGKPIKENSPLGPVRKYEKSKLAAEEVCQSEFKGKQLTIFRSVNIVGPGQPEKAVIPVLFKKAIAGEPLEIFGPAESFLQLLFVEDVVDAFVQIIERNGLAGIYNLASADKIRLDELALRIKDICRSKSEIRLTNQTAAPFSEVMSARIEKALGWRAQTTIAKILENYHQKLDLSTIPHVDIP